MVLKRLKLPNVIVTPTSPLLYKHDKQLYTHLIYSGALIAHKLYELIPS